MRFKMFFLFIFAFAHLSSNEFAPLNQTQTDFLLIRHGETDWNKENRVQGQTDNPLNATGIAQAEGLAQKMVIHHPDISPVLYSSTMNRAVVTAQKTADAFQAAGLEIVDLIQIRDLQEYNWGEAEGLPVPERVARFAEKEKLLNELYPDRKERWNYTHIPASETLNELVSRTKKALIAIAQEHPGEKVAVFTHGRLINSLIIDTEDLQKDVPGLPNCAVVHFRYSADNPEKPIQFIKIEDLLGK